MNWMVEKNRLCPDQVDALDLCRKESDGSIWLQGFAGSGKSIVLVYAIREALDENPNISACVVLFTHALIDMIRTGLPNHKIPIMTYHRFKNNQLFYDVIFVDEVQDLPADIIGLLRSCCKKLIVAGDEEQSIYRDGASPEEIARLIEPKRFRFQVIYRLTQKIKNIAQSILPTAKIETTKVFKGMEVDVVIAKAKDKDEEVQWVLQTAEKYALPGDPVTIILPHHDDIRSFLEALCRQRGAEGLSIPDNKYGKPDYSPVNSFLKDNNLPYQYIGNTYGSLEESDERPLIYLMTYHGAKGLDFDTVFLPFLSSNLSLWEDDNIGARLFFVGITRTRRNLFLSYHGTEPHRYIKMIPHELVRVQDCEEALRESDGRNDDIDPFDIF